MYRNVEINIPIFIGTIIIVALVSAALIWGVNIFINNMQNTKKEFNSSMHEFNEYFEITSQNIINETNSNQIYW